MSAGRILADPPARPMARAPRVIACQRHFSIYTENVVFDVRLVEAAGARHDVRYVIPHLFE